jgi:hypothetical protein
MTYAGFNEATAVKPWKALSAFSAARKQVSLQ